MFWRIRSSRLPIEDIRDPSSLVDCTWFTGRGDHEAQHEFA